VKNLINVNAGTLSNWFRSASGRVIYALALWVLAFSALEQFADLSKDLFAIRPLVFHTAACAAALAAAIFESVTLRGVSGLRHLWDRPDPIEDITHQKCNYRAALFTDLQKVRKLAIKRYGWAFALNALQRWHRSNSKCLFLMLSEGRLAGYVDAFPIAEVDYQFLLGGGEERLITPIRDTDVESSMSFYIASVVIDEGWGARLPSLLKQAMNFYSGAYPNKPWKQLCAIGYSAAGRALLEAKDMRAVMGDSVKVAMYSLDAGISCSTSRLRVQLCNTVRSLRAYAAAA
jgi:hypothetical protein